MLPGIAAYTLYIRGVALIGAPRASIISTLEPVTAVTLSLTLGYKTSILQFTGITLVLASAVTAALQNRQSGS
ncbi:EamA family transporter [Pyrolobus fumarii]|uniref:EamA family transporter n=1 Tax=Pyrolobus fumarii TaxID=54252 RepID=UPI001432C447|nr:EamA family transporter [Pyrolobus fumarii]